MKETKFARKELKKAEKTANIELKNAHITTAYAWIALADSKIKVS